MKKVKRPLTITVTNGKGGVGKTTISRFLPFELAKRGYKVLVVDEDPQSNLTKSMILTKVNHDQAEVESAADIFILGKTMMAGIRDNTLSDLIVTVVPNLDIIPSSFDFKSFPVYLSKIYGVAEKGDPDYYEIESKKLKVIRDLLAPLKSNYDFIFIDTPPTTSDFTRTAVFASDYVIIAFQTQSDSLDGARQFIDNDMTELHDTFHAETDILGVLINQMSRDGAIDNQVVADGKAQFGEQNMFTNILPFFKRLQAAPRTGISDEGYWNEKVFNDLIKPLANDFEHRLDLMGEIDNG